MITEKNYATTSFESGTDGDDDVQLQSVLLQRLMESNTVLTYLIGKYQVAANTPGEDTLYMQQAVIRVTKHGSMSFYPGTTTPAVTIETISELKAMLDANQGAISVIEKNGGLVDYVTFMVSEDQQNKKTVNVSKLSIDDPPVCVQCGDTVVYDDMVDHVVSSNCLSQKTKAAEEANGWQLLDAEHEAVLNKTNNVPHKMVASSFDMWTPKWVHQAIEHYERNKGYAGLTLQDYLDKMAAHQTK